MEMAKDDVKSIITGINRFMPDFSVTKDDLVNIKSSFVIAFYRHYLNELRRNCRTLCNSDGDSEDVLEMCPRGIAPEMFLFLQTRDILSRIGVSYFTICDFYRPSNRTRLTIKVCLNYLLYIQENIPKAQALLQDFNSKVKESVSRTETILAKKKLIGELSHQIGLNKEKLCTLQKEYATEKNLQITPLDIQHKLDNEILELNKSLENIEIHIKSQEHKKIILDAQIKELKTKVVSDNYESQKEILEKLEIRIQERNYAILESQKLLEDRYKELAYTIECRTLLQNCDISPLENIEKLDRLKQKVKEMKSIRDKTYSAVDQKQADLEMAKQDLVKINKKQEEDVKDLTATLSKMSHEYERCAQELHAEKILHKDLEKKYSHLKKELNDREEACAKLEEEQVVIQTELQRIYQQMLSSQNLITTPFKEALSRFE